VSDEDGVLLRYRLPEDAAKAVSTSCEMAVKGKIFQHCHGNCMQQQSTVHVYFHIILLQKDRPKLRLKGQLIPRNSHLRGIEWFVLGGVCWHDHLRKRKAQRCFQLGSLPTRKVIVLQRYKEAALRGGPSCASNSASWRACLVCKGGTGERERLPRNIQQHVHA